MPDCRSAAALALAALMAAACARAKEAPPPPPPVSLESIQQNVQETVDALTNRDAAKAGAGYASDAVLINARGKFDTQVAITRYWVDALTTPAASKNVQLDLVKWGASGDMAYVLSRSTNGATTPSGYVLTVLERRSGGALRILAQMSVPDEAAKK